MTTPFRFCGAFAALFILCGRCLCSERHGVLLGRATLGLSMEGLEGEELHSPRELNRPRFLGVLGQNHVTFPSTLPQCHALRYEFIPLYKCILEKGMSSPDKRRAFRSESS